MGVWCLLAIVVDQRCSLMKNENAHEKLHLKVLYYFQHRYYTLMLTKFQGDSFDEFSYQPIKSVLRKELWKKRNDHFSQLRI